MRSGIDTLVVCACDEKYFPLAKGLLLSILEQGPLAPGIGVAFIDIGCGPSATQWLRDRGVEVCVPDPDRFGGMFDSKLGYQRAQTCRPLLPKLFPGVTNLVWMDSDIWVQDVSIFSRLRSWLTENPDKLLITPECHYTYSHINDDPIERQSELLSYYEPVFGPEIARRMCLLPILNTAFFAMAADNRIWAEWESELRRIYVEGSEEYAPLVRHMAEGMALNVAARRGSRALLFDPLYNYLCMWTLPFRDAAGVVRVALPPYAPVGVLHLAGGWANMGKRYFDRGLLYRAGSYLTDEDKSVLFQERNASVPGPSRPGWRTERDARA